MFPKSHEILRFAAVAFGLMISVPSIPVQAQETQAGSAMMETVSSGYAEAAEGLRIYYETYGEGERAHRTAYSALKHQFEKKGDRWVSKDGKGPSDPRAKNPRAREGKGKSYGGVDLYGNSKKELYERAKKLGIQGRSGMSKEELAEAIARKQ
jgi:hypothetical protein